MATFTCQRCRNLFQFVRQHSWEMPTCPECSSIRVEQRIVLNGIESDTTCDAGG